MTTNQATARREDGVPPSPSATELLRTQTRSDHDAVDAAFLRLSFNSREGYGGFLMAHARILPLAERLLDPQALLPGWHGRTAALRADLTALGLPEPEELDVALPEGEAARWGALYVLEGSRLGGAVLQKRVPSGLPVAFLGAVHPSGGWRTLLDRVNSHDQGASWQAAAVNGAKALFSAYRTAALLQLQQVDGA